MDGSWQGRRDSRNQSAACWWGCSRRCPPWCSALSACCSADPSWAIVVLVVVAVVLAAWARFGGDRRVLASIGGRDADPVRDARLFNLAEGLSISAGVRQPRLMVIDSPGLNAMAAGSRPGRSVVGVTSGLLSELDRIELEAVLAEELIQIRRHETLPATVLVATLGVGRAIALPGDRDAQVDLAAVALTRYPPALAAALEKVDAKGAAVSGQAATTAHLWLADPSLHPGAQAGPTDPSRANRGVARTVRPTKREAARRGSRRHRPGRHHGAGRSVRRSFRGARAAPATDHADHSTNGGVPTTTTTRPKPKPKPVATAPLTGLLQTNPAQLIAPAVVVKIDNVDAARPQTGLEPGRRRL